MGSSDLVNAWLTSPQFGAGSEVWMYRQARLMKKLSLTVIIKNHRNSSRFQADGFDLTTIPELKRLPKNQFLKYFQKMLNSIQNRPYKGLRISSTELKWWEEQITKNRPQVVLAHFGPWALEYFPLFNRFNIPLVAHFHGFDLSSAIRSPTYRKRLKERTPHFASCVIVAEYMREYLVESGVADRNIHLIPCGAPTSEFSLSNNIHSEHCQCLSVGRMVRKKRPDLTIRAFAEAVKEYPNASLCIIGDGPLLENAKSLASELDVMDKVTFLGYQGPDVVREKMSEASLFIQHSVTGENGDKEGWPVAIAEAACSGLPIVSTRHASIPQQVNDGVSGLLCDEGDWKSMAKNLSTLFKSPALRVKMGKASRELILDFDTRNQVTKLEQVLLDVAENDRAKNHGLMK